MKRKEFIEKLGIGAAFVLTSTCMGACTRDEAEPPRDLDFIIDLSEDKYSALQELGGYVIEDQVVVARSITGDYLAATLICSHESLAQITYSKTHGQWFCTAHEARFDENGEGQNANGSRGLEIYNTEQIGNNLRVFT